MNDQLRRAARSSALASACLVLITASGAPSSARSYSLPFVSPPVTRVTFPSQRYQVGDDSREMAAGDFNGDGYRDVAVANQGFFDRGTYVGGYVSILLGYGDGTLVPQIHLATPRTPQSVVAADFNRDGRDDLAVGFADRGELGVFLSNGDGTFGAPTIYSQGTSGGSVKAGDFNKDGLVDLVATAGGSSAAVWLGAGDGSFSLAGTFPGGNSIAAVADINVDGKQDLVFSNYPPPGVDQPADVTLTFGHGDGTFDAPIHLAIGTFSLTVADFDGDGYPDLTSSGPYAESTAILRGSGDGTFTPWSEVPVESFGAVATDFNGDSRPDLAVTAGGYCGDTRVFLNEGGGHFEESSTLEHFVFPVVQGADDFDGDGKRDLVFVYDYYARPGDLEISRGHGNGTFDSRRDYPTGNDVRAIAIADFNLDGRLDVAVANAGAPVGESRAISILLGSGDGSLLQGETLQAGRSTSSVASGDFNNDGRADLAASNTGSNDISVFLGQGDGTFRTLPTFAAAQYPVTVLVGD